MAVGLDGGHRGTRLGQRQRQRPQTGPHLDHVVPGADAGQPGDAADGVRVDDEVLAEGAAGGQSVAVEEVAGLGRGEQWTRERVAA